jgi:hypothetical protein
MIFVEGNILYLLFEMLEIFFLCGQNEDGNGGITYPTNANPITMAISFKSKLPFIWASFKSKLSFTKLQIQIDYKLKGTCVLPNFSHSCAHVINIKKT